MVRLGAATRNPTLSVSWPPNVLASCGFRPSGTGVPPSWGARVERIKPTAPSPSNSTGPL